jgi:1,4-alpha-glucan branching enzyme
LDGSFVLILHTHLPYVLRHSKWPHGSDWLSEAAAECYIPILNECWNLVSEGITPNITISLSPVVVEQLADPEFPEILNEYFDEKIKAAYADYEYFLERPDESGYLELSQFWLGWYMARKMDFNLRYQRDLVAGFRGLLQKGAIAIQTCGVTHGYLPLLSREESVNAQVALAAQVHQKHFGERPRGIWMPECAYRPSYLWTPPVFSPDAKPIQRDGIEQTLARHGLEYTVVDSHLTRAGVPLDRFLSQFGHEWELSRDGSRYLNLQDSRAVHDLYRICSAGDDEAGTTAIFTRDAETTLQVWSGAFGYPGDPEYLEFHKKHHNNGMRYWRVTDSRADLGDKQRYRPDYIGARIRAQADHFVQVVEDRMRRYRNATGREGTLSAPFDTELFGHWWFEGPRFLGEVIRRLANNPNVRLRTAPQELDAKTPGVAIQIPEGSWGEGGHHKVWLNEETQWTWPLLYEIEARLVELINTHDPEQLLEERVLKQLARELLLQQASDWQFLISTESAKDYATRRFQGHYENAQFLIEFIEQLRQGLPMTFEQFNQLLRLEAQDRIFDDIDLSLWARQSSLEPDGSGEEDEVFGPEDAGEIAIQSAAKQPEQPAAVPVGPAISQALQSAEIEVPLSYRIARSAGKVERDEKEGNREEEDREEEDRGELSEAAEATAPPVLQQTAKRGKAPAKQTAIQQTEAEAEVMETNAEAKTTPAPADVPNVTPDGTEVAAPATATPATATETTPTLAEVFTELEQVIEEDEQSAEALREAAATSKREEIE